MPRPVLAWGHSGAGVPPVAALPPSPAFYLHPGASAHLGSPAGQRHPGRLGPAWPARQGAANAGDAGTMRSLPPELRRIASPPGAHAGTHGCVQSPAGCGAGSEEGEGKSSLCNFATVFTAGPARTSPESRAGPFPAAQGERAAPARALALQRDSHPKLIAPPKQPVQAPVQADIQNIKQN